MKHTLTACLLLALPACEKAAPAKPSPRADALPLAIKAYGPSRIVIAGVNGEARGLAEAAQAAAGDIPVDTVNLGATAGA